MQLPNSDLPEKEKARYSRLLTLTEILLNNHRTFQNLKETLKLLEQIYEQSQSYSGRNKIWQIEPLLISRYFIPAFSTVFHTRAYFKVDNFILRTSCHLAKDRRFLDELHLLRREIYRIRVGVKNQDFNYLCDSVIKRIDETQAERKRQYRRNNIEQFQRNFFTKQDAVTQIERHEDFLNFSLNSQNFKRQYVGYINMLRGALRVGAIQKVKYVFPKSCTGCIIFSLVNAGHRAREEQISIIFLQEFTKGWFTSTLYYCILEAMKRMYRKMRKNESFNDKAELVCLRFSSYNRSCYDYLQKISSKYSNGDLARMRRVTHRRIFDEEIEKISYKLQLQKEYQNFRWKLSCKSHSLDKFLNLTQIVSLEEALYLKEKINAKMELLGFQLKKVQLCFVHSPSMLKFKRKAHYSYDFMLFLAKTNSGRAIAGFCSNPCTYSGIKGNADLFLLTPNESFQIGQVLLSQIVSKKDEKQMKQERNIIETKMMEKKAADKQYQYDSSDFFNKLDRRIQITQEEEITEQPYEQSQSEEDEQISFRKSKQVSHKLNFVTESQTYSLLLSMKQEVTQEANKSWANFISQLKQTTLQEPSMDIIKFEWYIIKGNKISKQKN